MIQQPGVIIAFIDIKIDGVRINFPPNEQRAQITRGSIWLPVRMVFLAMGYRQILGANSNEIGRAHV